MAASRSAAPAGWIDAVRAAPTSALRIEALAGAAAALVDGPAGCPRVLAALSAALDEHLLPFGTDLYAELFRAQAADGSWLAAFLLGRAQGKAADARRLGGLALAAGDPIERAILADQAGLDGEQAREALAAFDRTFPRALEPADRAALDELCAAGADAVAAEPADPGDDLPDLLADRALERLRAAALWLLLADELPPWADAAARPEVERAMRGAAARELAAAGQLAVAIERRRASAAPEALAAWLGERARRHERLSVEEPLELLYALRFGHYP